MIVRTPQYARTRFPATTLGHVPPPAAVEWAFYAYILYAFLGGMVGLSVPLAGIAILGVLAAHCVGREWPRIFPPLGPIAFPLACGASYLAVQVGFHGESLMGDDVRDFVPWLLMLIVVQSLAGRRGFIERFALVALVTGLAVLPFMNFRGGGTEVARAGLDRAAGAGALSNPNSLAEWFGFCCICLTIIGVETKHTFIRAVSWSLGVGCLVVIGLTVSRGTLLSVAVAILIVFQRLLKRSFLPLLAILGVVWIVYLSGIFDQAASSFTSRALEDTGRTDVWPLAFERFLGSPIFGVGASKTGTFVPLKNKIISPHNTFLFFALSSGVLPLLCYVGYWIRVVQGAIRAHAEQAPGAPFLLPLVVYCLLTVQFGNITFMSHWLIATLAMALAAGAASQARRATETNPFVRNPVTARSRVGAPLGLGSDPSGYQVPRHR